MEIERKWLTKGWPQGLCQQTEYKMRQGYISLHPTVRIREEQSPQKTEYVLCFKGPAGVDGLAREEIETCIEKSLFDRLERFIAKPLIEKQQRRYLLPEGLVLEANLVDPGQPGEFWYAEVEFATEQQAKEWQPGALAEYLSNEVTGTPGQSMAAYWANTRGTIG